MALTIKDLHSELKNRVKFGQGDYIIFVTDDEEANGYHALWGVGMSAKEMDEESLEYCEENNHDLLLIKSNHNKALYVGDLLVRNGKPITNSAVTIKMLYDALTARMEKGEGDYVVFVTDDEEANGYHALYYSGSTPEEIMMDGRDEDLKYLVDNNSDALLVKKAPEKSLYIG